MWLRLAWFGCCDGIDVRATSARGGTVHEVPEPLIAISIDIPVSVANGILQ